MLRSFLLFLVSFIISALQPALATDIYYPGFERTGYQTELLKLALSYTPEKNYRIKAFGADLPKGRSFDLLEKNAGIDVMMGGATLSREEKYQPIRIPLLKGLNGWRVPLVKKGQEALFSNIKTIDELKQLIPGQFHTWSDTRVLESNGIFVAKGGNAEGLYTMLHKGRFDYFPRSILEIKWNYQQYKHLDIAIEPNTLIQYPTAYYFYVSKENTQLAADIEKGLEAAMADGSFDTLFNRYYGEQVAELQSSNRRIFELKNPLLSDKTPLHRKTLWLDLGDVLTVIK